MTCAIILVAPVIVLVMYFIYQVTQIYAVSIDKGIPGTGAAIGLALMLILTFFFWSESKRLRRR